MSIKQERMNDRIHQILSQLLLREVSDPRLQGITVTEVQLDPELMKRGAHSHTRWQLVRKSSVARGAVVFQWCTPTL